MGPVEFILFVLLLLLCAAAFVGVRAAYSNGCNDGYGASQDPKHPGYAKAAKILKSRWPEIERRLKEDTREDMPHWLVGRQVHEGPDDFQNDWTDSTLFGD